MIGDTPRCFQPPQIYRAPSDFNIHHLQPPTSSNRHIPSATPIPGSRPENWILSIVPSRELTYPTKRESRKLIDSKLPWYPGYVIVPRRVFFTKRMGFHQFFDQVSYALFGHFP